jgi:hypothetical protein
MYRKDQKTICGFQFKFVNGTIYLLTFDQTILLDEERAFWELFKSKEFRMEGCNTKMYHNNIKGLLKTTIHRWGSHQNQGI